MIALLAASVLASVPIPMKGFSADQKAILEDALAKIPDCWKSCDGKPVPMVLDKKDDSINAAYDDDPNDDGNDRDYDLSVTEASFPGPKFETALVADAQDSCESPEALRAYDADMEATLVHELAHYQHLHGSCMSATRDANGKPVSNFDAINKGFLTLRYKQSYKALISDPQWRPLKLKIRKLEKLKHPTDAQQEALCALDAERDALIQKHGILERFPNDIHAVEAGDGVEYWAMCIETLVRQPEVFCRFVSPEEIQWLHDNFGGCLAGMSARAPCYLEQGTAPAGPAAGIRR